MKLSGMLQIVNSPFGEMFQVFLRTAKARLCSRTSTGQPDDIRNRRNDNRSVVVIFVRTTDDERQTTDGVTRAGIQPLLRSWAHTGLGLPRLRRLMRWSSEGATQYQPWLALKGRPWFSRRTSSVVFHRRHRSRLPSRSSSTIFAMRAARVSGRFASSIQRA